MTPGEYTVIQVIEGEEEGGEGGSVGGVRVPGGVEQFVAEWLAPVRQNYKMPPAVPLFTPCTTVWLHYIQDCVVHNTYILPLLSGA